VRLVFGVEVSVRVLFETPTPAGLAARIAGAGPARVRLARRARRERMPLSFAQRRLWFLAQMEGPSPTYNLPLVARLTGRIDVAALGVALDDLITRHEVLRTVFPVSDGEPCQQVLEPDHLGQVLRVAEATTEAQIAALTAVELRHGFDLSAEIPLRALLIETRPDTSVLVVVIHHVAGDGWSTDLFTEDLCVAYTARCEGREPSWEPLPVQYADYTLWQRELLGAEDAPGTLQAAQIDYWRQALAGAPQELTLPRDRPRPAVPSHRGHTFTFDIPRAVHEQLASLTREHGVTSFMVVQAGLAVLLSRLGAGEDIPIGTAVAGRTDQALDRLVGFFVNTLVLRTDLTGNPAFTELLARVRESSLAALDHQDVPFERLVEVLAPTRMRARHPLFQVMLAVEKDTSATLELPGIQMETLPPQAKPAKFDRSVTVTETFEDDRPAGMRGSLTVAADMFDQATADTIGQRFVRVLTGVAAKPQARVRQVQPPAGEQQPEEFDDEEDVRHRCGRRIADRRRDRCAGPIQPRPDRGYRHGGEPPQDPVRLLYPWVSLLCVRAAPAPTMALVSQALVIQPAAHRPIRNWRQTVRSDLAIGRNPSSRACGRNSTNTSTGPTTATSARCWRQ